MSPPSHCAHLPQPRQLWDVLVPPSPPPKLLSQSAKILHCAPCQHPKGLLWGHRFVSAWFWFITAFKAIKPIWGNILAGQMFRPKQLFSHKSSPGHGSAEQRTRSPSLCRAVIKTPLSCCSHQMAPEPDAARGALPAADTGLGTRSFKQLEQRFGVPLQGLSLTWQIPAAADLP